MPESNARITAFSPKVRNDLADEGRIGPGNIQFLLENIETCGARSRSAGRGEWTCPTSAPWDLVRIEIPTDLPPCPRVNCRRRQERWRARC